MPSLPFRVLKRGSFQESIWLQILPLSHMPFSPAMPLNTRTCTRMQNASQKLGGRRWRLTRTTLRWPRGWWHSPAARTTKSQHWPASPRKRGQWYQNFSFNWARGSSAAALASRGLWRRHLVWPASLQCVEAPKAMIGLRPAYFVTVSIEIPHPPTQNLKRKNLKN